MGNDLKAKIKEIIKRVRGEISSTDTKLQRFFFELGCWFLFPFSVALLRSICFPAFGSIYTRARVCMRVFIF